MITSYIPLFAHGLWVTTKLWALCVVISTVIGTLLGILCASRTTIGDYATPIINCYLFVLRGIPVYVQLLVVYFVLPEIVGLNLSAATASVVALSLCSSAYITNIIRSGISAIDDGQWQAAQVSGMSKWQTMRWIILPQAIRIISPVMVNEYESLIKSTALFSAIGVTEITKVGRNIIAVHLNPIPVYGAVICLYLLISAVLNGISWILRIKFTRDY